MEGKIVDLSTKRAMMSFRETFVRLRKERGWTQQTVADLVGISANQIKKYEKGTSVPNLPALGKIALAFGVSADELVFEDGEGVAGAKLDKKLLQRFEKVAKLPKAEKDAVILLIDSVIAKQTLKEVIGS